MPASQAVKKIVNKISDSASPPASKQRRLPLLVKNPHDYTKEGGKGRGNVTINNAFFTMAGNWQ